MGHDGERIIHDISLIFLGETEKAIKVTEGKDKDAVWLPKSQIEYELKDDGSVEVQIPEWLHREKGFIS
jgi:hypothetical protein